MSDETEYWFCECGSEYREKPDKCGCGWVNPDIEAMREGIKNQSSIERLDEIIDAREIRERAVQRVEEAKLRYGDDWQAKYLRELLTEKRRDAIANRVQVSKQQEVIRKKMMEQRAKEGRNPHGFYNEEEFLQDVARREEETGRKISLDNSHNERTIIGLNLRK